MSAREPNDAKIPFRASHLAKSGHFIVKLEFERAKKTLAYESEATSGIQARKVFVLESYLVGCQLAGAIVARASSQPTT